MVEMTSDFPQICANSFFGHLLNLHAVRQVCRRQLKHLPLHLTLVLQRAFGCLVSENLINKFISGRAGFERKVMPCVRKMCLKLVQRHLFVISGRDCRHALVYPVDVKIAVILG